MTTPEQERARIAEVYSGMADEELQRIAQSGDDLTDSAKEALKTEMARRGLAIEVTPSPAARIREARSETDIAHPPVADVAAPDQTVMLRRFRDLPEALLAKGSLESAGIESYLVDDNMVRMDWFISNLLGGVKLHVYPEDVEAAEAILNQPIPENLEIDGLGNYEQPKCPQCQSLDVSYQELEKLSYGFAFLGVPFPFQKKAWTCHACRAEWKETDSGDPTENRTATP